MPTKYEELIARLGEHINVAAAAGLLHWDQQTYMPPGGAPARARQLATLARIAHEIYASRETGDLLRAAEDETADLPEESVERAMVRMARRDYDLANKLPVDFVSDYARVRSESQEVWTRARDANDYESFRPWLSMILDYSLRYAEYVGYDERPYDALLDMFEPGLRTAELQAVFDELREELVPLVRAVLARADRVDDGALFKPYDVEAQRRFGEMVSREIGFDYERGREDESVHPFTTNFSINDVRITTRFNPNWLAPALFGTLHEAGHGMYEQGVDQALEGTILATGASLGVHESQSRLWENIVGRSRPFWRHYFPKLQAIFPEQLGRVSLDAFYLAINKVSPSLIRVEADELTYNLHILLRFQLEIALLEGDVDVGDLPLAWNEKMESMIGVRPPDDTQGVLQDVHWSMGLVGYFPTYSLGNLLSAQLYEKAVADRPAIPDQIARGEFADLLGWLRANVHQYGRRFFPRELALRATGEPMGVRSYMAYLRGKYGEIYGL